MSARPYTAGQRDAAFEVIYRHRIWYETLRPVRDAILAGSPEEAKRQLVENHELTPSEADILMAYYDPGVKGREVVFVEIAPSALVFAPICSDDVDEDDYVEDPLDPGETYFARRGLEIDKMITMSRMEGSRQVNQVFFRGRIHDVADLDQVWRVVEVSRSDEPSD
ncbi:hypothetical protein G6L37_00760 [Agrobacterium rubi]|nr:hypothetical protein [Agrobacterium rubi]NTF23921.1 hypothetical protein [Agrobacterium rubi]